MKYCSQIKKPGRLMIAVEKGKVVYCYDPRYDKRCKTKGNRV